MRTLTPKPQLPTPRPDFDGVEKTKIIGAQSIRLAFLIKLTRMTGPAGRGPNRESGLQAGISAICLELEVYQADIEEEKPGFDLISKHA